jgi:recombination protein RecR
MANNVLPAPVQNLINEFARLPGVGPKSASRLVFYLLRGGSENQANELAEALVNMKENTTFCATCFNITESDPCVICNDEGRNQTTLCVVEEPLDLVSLERTRAFDGRYHVLHGALSPVEGIGPDELKIEELVQRIQAGGIQELILATNATLEGDSTSSYLQRRLANTGVKITRLARGLPVGGDLEYTDEVTLGRAFEGRREMN